MVPTASPTFEGEAFATFLAGTVAGEASVTAGAGSASGGTTVSVLPGLPAVLSVTAVPPSIPLDGSATIEAHVSDQYGSPVADGTLVSFSTTLAILDPPSAGTLGGVAVSTLHATGEPGLAIVTAQAGAVSDSVQVTIGEGAPMEIVLTADPEQIVADGVSSSTITALVLDAFGQPITQTIPIAFATALGQVNPPTAWVIDGQAVIYLTGTQNGVATVTAQAASASGVVSVELVPGPPGLLSLLVRPAEVPPQGQSSILAQVTDLLGHPVADGTAVEFSATLGGVVPPVVTTVNGVAQSTFVAGLVAGHGTITATASAAASTAQITVLPGPAAAMTMAADPPVLQANGLDQALITSTVVDAYGNLVADGSLPGDSGWTTEVTAVVQDAWNHRVADGTPITLTVSLGSIEPQVVHTTYGAASAVYTGVPAGDWAHITAWASPDVYATVQVWLEKTYGMYLPLLMRASNGRILDLGRATSGQTKTASGLEHRR